MIKMRRAFSFMASSGALLGLMLLASPANAQVVLAGDLDYAAPISTMDSSGFGFAFRFGYQAHAPYLVATPELAFTYDEFSGGLGSKVSRALAGIRLGIGDFVRSGAFLHMGVGHVRPDAPDYSHDDLSYDLGAFLDFAVLPKLSVGGHISYNRVTGGPAAVQWATAGVNVAMLL
jgi:hypothetical protein